MELRSIINDTRAASAVEMALVIPIVLILLFGSIEVGNYFMSEHAVQKGVRDAARYAARIPLASLTDPGCSVTADTTVTDSIAHVARTGNPSPPADQSLRLSFWTSNDSVNVSLACPTGQPYSSAGLYADFPDGAPVVTVTATVAYPALFDFLPFVPDDGLTLNAESQAAVMGA